MDIVAAEMDIARINCAHDDAVAWSRMIANVRAAAARAGRAVAVSMDLPGPKLRTGPIACGPAVGRARVTRSETGHVVAPARIWLTSASNPAPAPPSAPPSRPPLAVEVDATWLAARKPGDTVKAADARQRTRTFTIVAVGEHGALAEGIGAL